MKESERIKGLKNMKPYRIKHKPTGLYYKPNSGVCNLSKSGKVYLNGNNAMSYYKNG